MDANERAWRILTAGIVMPVYGLTVEDYWELSNARHIELVAAVAEALNAVVHARAGDEPTKEDPSGDA